MAITAADVLVKIGVDGAEKVRNTLSGAGDQVESFGSKALKAGGMLTAGLTVPIVGMGALAFNAASNLNESINKTNVIFGSSADEMQAWSQTSADAFGMSRNAALTYSSSYAGMFDGVFETNEEMANTSQRLTGLTADFASFHNLNPEDAFTVISSALAGETEAIRRYGVDVSAAAVEEKALQMGLAATAGELTETDKKMARYQILLDETSEEQGDFARTAGGAANQQRILRAKLADSAATIGTKLMPIGIKLLGWLNSALDAFSGLSGRMQTVIVIVAGLAAAIGPVVSVLGVLASSLGAIGAVLGVILSPVGLVVAAVAALGFAAYYAYTHNLAGFKDMIDQIVDAFGLFKPAIDDIMDAFQALKEGNFGEAWDELKEAFGSFIDVLPQFADQVGNAIGTFVDNAMAAVSAIDWGALWNNVTDVTATIVEKLGDLGAAVLTWVTEAIGKVDWGAAWDTVTDVTFTIVEKLGDLGAAIVTWVSDAVGAVDWGTHWESVTDVTTTIVEKLGDLGAALITWVTNAATGINWGGIADTALDITATITQKLGDLVTALASWVTTAADGVNWGGIADTATDVTSSVVGKLGDLAGALLTWASDAIAGIDWAGLFADVVDVTETIVTKFGDIYLAVYTWIFDAIASLDWPGFFSAVADVTSTIVGKLGDLATALFNWVSAAAGGVDWAEIASVAEDITGDIVAKLGDLGVALLGWVTGAIDGLDLSGATATLVTKGTDVIGGFATGVADGFKLVTTWFSDNFSVDAITGLMPDLSSIPNPLDPIIGFFNTAWETLQTVGGKIEDLLAKVPSWVPGFGGGGGDDTQKSLEWAMAASEALTGIATAVETARQNIVLAVSVITGQLTSLQEAFARFVTNMATYGTDAGENFQENLEIKMRDARTDTGTKLDEIQVKLGEFVTQAGGFGTSAGARFQSELAKGFILARQSAEVTKNLISSVLGNLATEAGAKGTQAGASFQQGLASGLILARQSAEVAANLIKSALSFSLYAQGYSGGSSFSSGIYAGAMSNYSLVYGAGVSLANALNAGYTNTARVFSPSRVAMEGGKSWTEGLILGALSDLQGVMGAGQMLAGALAGFPAPGRTVPSYAATMTRPAVVQHFYALKSDEFTRLLADAQAGGSLARDLPGELRYW